MKKLLIFFVGILFFGCSSKVSQYTVMITNLSGNSGGSGTIVDTTATKSKVLTNAHVCNVVKNGGIVSNEEQTGFVTSYKISEIHDLCEITVAAGFSKSAKISPYIPLAYDETIVSGHPHLLPTILSYGHLTGRKLVRIVIGWKKCSYAEQLDPNTSIICSVVGKIPLIRAYEGVSVSSTVQPGSSGSGVYTSGGYIQAVIFAGSGDFSYGTAVPYEYVYNFLNSEAKTLPAMTPNMMIFNEKDDEEESPSISKVVDLCKRHKSLDSKLCSELSSFTISNDLIQKN